MGVLAAMFSGFAWITLLLMAFMKVPGACWNTSGILLGFSFLMEGLTFLAFNDPNCKDPSTTCRSGPGAGVAIAAMVMLLLSSILTCVMRAPKEPAFELDCTEVLRDDLECTGKKENPQDGDLLAAEEHPSTSDDADVKNVSGANNDSTSSIPPETAKVPAIAAIAFVQD
jgi:hypothetical protein